MSPPPPLPPRGEGPDTQEPASGGAPAIFPGISGLRGGGRDRRPRQGGAGAGGPVAGRGPPGARLCNSTFDNSVNSLCFSPGSPDLFVSGVREGTVCFWDARCLGQGPTASVQAHDWKLNRVELARGGTLLATSGRDGALRMWDARKLGPAGLGQARGEGRPGAKRGYGGAAKREILWEGRSHSCRSYNVGCTFLYGDRSVATGSEDGAVWVYDTDTGRPRRALTGHTSVVHCVSAPPAASGRMVLASCSIDSSDINVWTPVRGKPQAPPGAGATGARRDQALDGAASVPGAPASPPPAPRGGAPLTRLRARELAAAPCNVGAGGGVVPMEVDGVGSGGGGGGRPSPERAAAASGGAEVRRASSIGLRTETREEAMQRAQRAAIETLMHQHGDLMLRIFHTYDYSFRAAFNWQALLEHIRGVCEARGLPHEGPGAANSGGAGGAVDETDPVAVINAVHSMAQDFAAALRQQQASILADEPTLPALGVQETPAGSMRVPRPPQRHSS